MAETQKLTIDRNNILIYQTLNATNNVCINQRNVISSDFKDAIPVKDPDEIKFIYLNLDFEQKSDKDWNYLGFDGTDFQLHPVDTSLDRNTFPSVLPKRKNASQVAPPHLQGVIPGYTLSHFQIKSDKNNLYYRDEVYHEYLQYDKFALEENWAYTGSDGRQDYKSQIIIEDSEQFTYTQHFDSHDYLWEGADQCKIVNLPCIANNKIYNKLTFYDRYGELEFYYKEIKDDGTENYIQINDNVSFVTFIPLKKPESLDGDEDYKLEWILCTFCRGEASSKFWSDVVSDNQPRRIKMEWRPLHLKDNKTIKLSDEQYHEFLTPLPYEKPSEQIVPADSMVPADYSNIQTVEIKAYNIDYKKDETNIYNKGILYDNRDIDKTGEYTAKFHTPYSNEDVYLIQRDAYYTTIITEGQIQNEVRTVSTKSFILMDMDGYCLYCPELIEKYGIAFIKSDWVYRDENGELYVNVSESELKSRYANFWDSTNPTYPASGDIVKGEIYSTQYLNLKDSTRQLTPDTGYYNSTDRCSENLIYKYYEEYFIRPSTMEDLTGISIGNWNTLYNNRSGNIPMPRLYCCGEQYDIFYDNILETKLKKITGSTNYNEIVVWERNKNIRNTNDKITSHFVRYRIEESFNYDRGPQFKEVAFWLGETEKFLTTINGTYYDRQTNFIDYIHDFDNSIFINENDKFIIKQAIYIIAYSINYDISPRFVNSALPSTWTSYLNYKQGIYQKNEIHMINASRESTVSQDEYREEEIKTRSFMTPAEWYGTANQIIDDVPESQEWFWLDTLSNWCRYEISPFDKTSVMLCVWDGLGLWNPLVEILSFYMNHDNYALLRRYLYSPNFFKIGPICPNTLGMDNSMELKVYNPIKNGSKNVIGEVAQHPRDGQIRYSSILLLRDNKSILYKTKANMDYANVYYNMDYNTIARAFYPEHDSDQEAIMPLNKDEKRQYVIGSETQPVPCILKLANGNLAICYDFVAQTNGISQGILRNIVNTFEGIEGNEHEDTTELNRKCKVIFGDGSDKTIEKDWKKYIVVDTSEEIKSEIKNINDETLYSSTSLTQIRAGKMMANISITAPRPNPTTNDKNIEDYLERWNK